MTCECGEFISLLGGPFFRLDEMKMLLDGLSHIVLTSGGKESASKT